MIADDCTDSDSNEENWEEENDEEAEETRCLFSDKKFPNIDDAIKHLKISYNFDLGEMKQKHHMDFYDYIKVGAKLFSYQSPFKKFFL